ncbi:hypothetical protein M0P28_09485 [Streptococcus pasteurianus]|nr:MULTISPECIES: hypothetical protein [Streptococcus]MDV5117066.1 hypothetical protein [Streptococcus pasteurianus]MDV5154908.1 hypothetical protein [Streptococcus pasteurianus]MDV5163661.1 hypothetical protein [Streptococcus pasteurianus]WCQ72043.1 hypothetical protein M0P28_09485 [Streptococcus pasteurianus]
MLTLISFLLMLISILTVVLAANTADYQMKRDCKKIAVYTAFATIIISIIDFLTTIIF